MLHQEGNLEIKFEILNLCCTISFKKKGLNL